MALDTGNLCILTGNANPELAKEIADHIGVNLCDAYVGHFNNGETQVMISESIRGKDIFIIQPTSYPVNDNLMELLIMADACKRVCAVPISSKGGWLPALHGRLPKPTDYMDRTCIA